MMTRSHGPSRGARTFLFAAVLTLLAPALVAARAQVTGAIEGVVTDVHGDVVVFAEARLIQKDTNAVRTATSGEDGRFRFAFLQPGSHALSVTANGFATSLYEDVVVSVGQTTSVSVQLQLSGVGDTVTVVAGEAVGVDATSTAVSNTIENRMVANLPLSGRNFLDLAQLTPGVSFGTELSGAGVNNAGISGSRDRAVNISIDGVGANGGRFDDGRARSLSLQSVSVESVREFQVISGGASAEFGRSNGGFINVVTKSGTNEFSGSAYVYFSDKALAANNPGEVKASISPKDFRRFDPGVTFGGPIKENRAFFFASYERRDYEGGRANRIDPRLSDIFARRFDDPAEQGFIKQDDKTDSVLGKVDVNVTKNSNLTLRYGYNRGAQNNGIFDVPSWGRSANGREESRAGVFSGSLYYILSPTMANEFRVPYSRESGAGFYEGPDLPDVTVGGIDPTTGEPTSYRFGRPFFLPNSSSNARLQLVDNFTEQFGTHDFKTGFEFNRARVRQTRPAFARGRYVFASIDAFENYLDDPRNFGGLLYFSQFAPAGGRSAEEAGTQEFSQTEPAFFAQDSWRVRPNVTFNYGLRYDAQLQPEPLTPLAGRRYAQFIGRPDFPSDGSIPSDKRQWQPRLGVAWDPRGDGKTSVRASIGIYYARVPGFVVAGARNTDGAIGYDIKTCCGLDFLPAPPPELGVFKQTAGAPPFNPGVRVFASDFRNPRALHWGAGVEREVTHSLVAKFYFIYADSVHLTRFVNRNAAAFVGHFATDGRRLFDGPRPFARPDGSGIGDLITAESSGRFLYRAFDFEAARRFRNGFYFMANYVLSWSHSDTDEDSPYALAYADLLDLRPEYGYSDFDQRHRFSASGAVDLPHGFEISATFQARSAQPDTFFLLGDANGDGNAFDRPYMAGRDVGRNTARKKNRRSSLSVRVKRTTNFGEKRRLELFSEIFNMFNSTNPLPFSNPLLLNFDTAVRSGFDDPRQAQFGAKFVF